MSNEMDAISMVDWQQLVEEVLRDIRYEDYSFVVVPKDSVLLLQIVCTGTCNVTGEPLKWKSRKWFLSPHMTRGEIVQTAFKAVMTALEHEARELFKYKDVAIFDPHYDIDKLVELRSQTDALKERAPV